MRISFIAALAMLAIAGCGAQPAAPARVALTAAPTLSAPDLTATALCQVTSERVILWALFGTPTPAPNSTPTPVQPPGDPARGEQVFNNEGSCSMCHSVADESMVVGPSLMTVALRAPYKRPGMSAEDYLRAVILSPDDYIVPLTKPGVMPRSYAQTLTTEQINDLVAYLLTLD